MIKNYITGVKPENKYVLKILGFDKKGAQELIERFFEQYKVLDLDVKETPVQKNPGDFPRYTNMPVVIAKLTTNLSVSPEYARQLFCRDFSIPESMVIFRTAENPLVAQENLELLRNKLKGSSPLLDIKPDYRKEEQSEPGETYFGNLYNAKLLQVMAAISKKQEEAKHVKIDAPSPLFSWLQKEEAKELAPKQDTTPFNTQAKVGKVADTLNSGANKTLEK